MTLQTLPQGLQQEWLWNKGKVNLETDDSSDYKSWLIWAKNGLLLCSIKF